MAISAARPSSAGLRFYHEIDNQAGDPEHLPSIGVMTRETIYLVLVHGFAVEGVDVDAVILV